LVVSGVPVARIRSTSEPVIRSPATQVDLGAGDQVAGDGGGPVGVGLAVLDQDLDRVGGAADPQPVLEGRPDAVQDEGVGLAEAGQGPGLGADVAELDGPPLGAAAGPAAALLIVLARGQQP
jgi:hypothetical protein